MPNDGFRRRRDFIPRILFPMAESAQFDPIEVTAELTNEIVRHLIGLKRESAKLDYKASLDLAESRDKVECCKDIVAMANTAGGYLVVGVTNKFETVGIAENVLASLDEAKLRQQLRSYTAVPIDVFVNRAIELEGNKFGIITVLPTRHPLIVFEANGEYGKNPDHKIVFRRGEVFVRHGSSSSVWTQADVTYLYRRALDRDRAAFTREALANSSAESGDGLVDKTEQLLRDDPTKFATAIRQMIRRQNG